VNVNIWNETTQKVTVSKLKCSVYNIFKYKYCDLLYYVTSMKLEHPLSDEVQTAILSVA